MIDISQYKKLELLTEFAARKGVDTSGIRRSFIKGKRFYLDESEDALRIGRDWFIFSK